MTYDAYIIIRMKRKDNHTSTSHQNLHQLFLTETALYNIFTTFEPIPKTIKAIVKFTVLAHFDC